MCLCVHVLLLCFYLSLQHETGCISSYTLFPLVSFMHFSFAFCNRMRQPHWTKHVAVSVGFISAPVAALFSPDYPARSEMYRLFFSPICTCLRCCMSKDAPLSLSLPLSQSLSLNDPLNTTMQNDPLLLSMP